MFASALRNLYTTTWNGAKSYKVVDSKGKSNPDMECHDGRLTLFYKANRNIDHKIDSMMHKSSTEDLIDTFLISFNKRDCRGGSGEKTTGRNMFIYLAQNYPEQFIQIIHLIEDYGRFDDLLFLLPSVSNTSKIIENHVLDYIQNKILSDRIKMNSGKPISLLAKWLPTENDSKDKKYGLVQIICKHMNITPKQYRKEYISPMRAYLNIVEKLMCSNRWDEIDFNKVPSCAMHKLKKAFEKHTPEEFKEWKKGLKSNTTKVNAKQLFPHEILKEVHKNGFDELSVAQWKVIEEEVENYGTFSDCVCVVDTSDSMKDLGSLPFFNACALGLLVSNFVKGDFHNLVITFNTTPEFVEIPDGNIYERFSHIKRIRWGGSTNLQKTFDMILEKCKTGNVPDEACPKKIIIISDMQFDSVGGYRNTTNFEEIDRKYKESGYTRPNIVFWNVAARHTDDFPVTTDHNGTCIISGYSPAIIKSLLTCKVYSNINIMNETIHNDRYKPVKDALMK